MEHLKLQNEEDEIDKKMKEMDHIPRVKEQIVFFEKEKEKTKIKTKQITSHVTELQNNLNETQLKIDNWLVNEGELKLKRRELKEKEKQLKLLQDENAELLWEESHLRNIVHLSKKR